jgi:hypothetical protein
MRDRLPTLPHDLREYAWIHTGPGSESPPPVTSSLSRSEPPREEELDAIETGLLVDLWHSDVPRLVAADGGARCVVDDHREAFVLSLLDGESTVGAILEIADLPVAEVLTILCELCARGIVTLDRTKRLDSLTPEPLASVA